MSEKFRVDRKIDFQNMFYTKCTNIIYIFKFWGIITSQLMFFEVAFLIWPWGGSGISGKEVHMYKCVGVRFADYISVYLNIP